jgi:hypothetical protein
LPRQIDYRIKKQKTQILRIRTSCCHITRMGYYNYVLGGRRKANQPHLRDLCSSQTSGSDSRISKSSAHNIQLGKYGRNMRRESGLFNRLTTILQYHDMWGNPDTVDRKPSVELKWASTLQSLHGTVKRSSVRILSSGIRLHLLNLCLHIIKWQTASRCKES